MHTRRLVDEELSHTDDPTFRLATLQHRARQLLRTACDIGFHLGFKVPKSAPDFVGEIWSEDLVAQAFAHWSYPSRSLARYDAHRIALNPAYALSTTVGSGIWAEALSLARKTAGASFDLCNYHEQALRVAPTGADGLRQ